MNNADQENKIWSELLSTETSSAEQNLNYKCWSTFKRGTIESVCTVQKFCDCIANPFIRIRLEKGFTDDDLKNVFQRLFTLTCYCHYNGNLIISKLYNENMLLDTKLENCIFNVQEVLSKYSDVELEKMRKKQDKYGSTFNQKYTWISTDDVYIDVPFLSNEIYKYNSLEIVNKLLEIKMYSCLPRDSEVYLLFEECRFLTPDLKAEVLSKKTLVNLMTITPRSRDVLYIDPCATAIDVPFNENQCTVLLEFEHVFVPDLQYTQIMTADGEVIDTNVKCLVKKDMYDNILFLFDVSMGNSRYLDSTNDKSIFFPMNTPDLLCDLDSKVINKDSTLKYKLNLNFTNVCSITFYCYRYIEKIAL